MTFDVQFSIVVSGIGQRTITVTGVVATSAEDAIAVAKSTLVQVIATGVLKTG